MKLEELFARYQRKHLRGKSPNTIRLYGHTIRSFGKTLGRPPTVDDLTDEAIEDHMWRVVESGRSPASANKDRSQLICLWRWAAERGWIDRFPDVPAMQEPEQVPLGWLPAEIDALLEAADAEPNPVGDVPGGIWFGALLRILLDTGERIGAVRQLSRTALQRNYLLVPAASRKGRTRDRLFPLQTGTVAAVESLLQSHDDALMFPDPYSSTYIYRRFDRVLDRAGLPTDRRSKFHRLRRTVASAVARAGGDATAALDHASPKTTKKYLDPRIVGGVQVSDILGAYLRDPTLRNENDTKRHDRGEGAA
jgi:integrase